MIRLLRWNLAWMVPAVLLSGCGSGGESNGAGGDGGVAEAAVQVSVIRLTPEKIAAAKIHTAPCEPRQLDFSRRVAGHLDYDSARRLELRAPAFCVVKEVLVAPSQTVKKGEPLLVLSSAEVGLARDEVQKREADLKLAKLHSEWSHEVAGNVRDALAYLGRQPSMDELQQRFQGKRLGEYRDALLAAWSRLQLAQRTAASSEDMREQGLLSARTDQERRSQLEVAQAGFRSACEQAERDVVIQTGKAQADVEQAQRLLQVSREKLQALLQPFADNVGAVSAAINELTLRAPFDGQVQQRHVVPMMQVPEGQDLLDLASTDVLWVSAQIPERH